jgi:hypothetical protein
MNKRLAIFAGLLSIFTLGTNWAFMVYMSRQYNPGAIKIWEPFRSHPTASLGIWMVMGVCSGVYAGIKHSRYWFAVAGLNLVTYVLELCVS